MWALQEIRRRERRDTESHHPVILWADGPQEACRRYALDYAVAPAAVRCTEVDSPQEGC